MDKARKTLVTANLAYVKHAIAAACLKARREDQPTLVAVSKRQSVALILEAYEAGHRDFGENYAVELLEKASDQRILTQCPDINWHLIGHLQGNKVRKVLSIPRLLCIHSLDSAKLADSINSVLDDPSNQSRLPIDVFIQVNTSGEDNKSGITPGDTLTSICQHIKLNCARLHLCGLMTIGCMVTSLNSSETESCQNNDFNILNRCRDDLIGMQLMQDSAQLSMGMSLDYVTAIIQGSTHVRVGSLIFGQRG